MQLYKLADEYQALLLAVEASEGVLDEDSEKALDEIQEDFAAKVENVAKLVRAREAERDAIKAEADRLAKRARACDGQARWLKEYIKHQMMRAKREVVEGEILKVRLQNNPASCNVLDQSALPEDFIREIPAKFEPDKKSIIAALKDGAKVPGAELVQGQSVRIR